MLRRPSRLLLAVALAASLAACGSGGPAAADGPVATGIAPGATLIGTIGTPENPDEYVIGLTDVSGARVETLPAGAYTIKVDDRSRIHNWVLSGDGVEGVATDVSGTGEQSFPVTLKAGEYGYVCDPHPSMSGSVTVT